MEFSSRSCLADGAQLAFLPFLRHCGCRPERLHAAVTSPGMLVRCVARVDDRSLGTGPVATVRTLPAEGC